MYIELHIYWISIFLGAVILFGLLLALGIKQSEKADLEEQLYKERMRNDRLRRYANSPNNLVDEQYKRSAFYPHKIKKEE